MNVLLERSGLSLLTNHSLIKTGASAAHKSEYNYKIVIIMAVMVFL